jgi:hypothetical protein
MSDPRFQEPNSMINWNKLIGKTVFKVDTKSDNVVIIEFTDRTKVQVDTEPIGHGLYTPVLYSE